MEGPAAAPSRPQPHLVASPDFRPQPGRLLPLINRPKIYAIKAGSFASVTGIHRSVPKMPSGTWHQALFLHCGNHRSLR